MLGHRGANRDALIQAAEVPVPHPLGAGLRHRSAWDAWGASRRGEEADVPRPVPPDADAEILADRERDVQAQDGSASDDSRWADREQSGALYKLDVARFAARSCAGQQAGAGARLSALARGLVAARQTASRWAEPVMAEERVLAAALKHSLAGQWGSCSPAVQLVLGELEERVFAAEQRWPEAQVRVAQRLVVLQSLVAQRASRLAVQVSERAEQLGLLPFAACR